MSRDASRPVIAFSAHPGYGSNLTYSSGETIIFGSVDYNYGNGYNPSTGRFTAPVKGVYKFCLLTGWQESGRVRVSIRKNYDASNSIFVAYRNLTDANWLNTESSVTTLLEEGDVIDFTTDSTLTFYRPSTIERIRYMNLFTGILIYEDSN